MPVVREGEVMGKMPVVREGEVMGRMPVVPVVRFKDGVKGDFVIQNYYVEGYAPLDRPAEVGH